jgi:hypothetical protein
LIFFLSRNSNHSIIVPIPRIPSLLFLAAFFSFLYYITYTAYLEINEKFILTGETDLYLEFSYIASFFNGVNSKPGFLTDLLFPFASGNPDRSEYLPTIYAALLQDSGATPQFAVSIQTLMLFFSMALLQHWFAYLLSKSELAACLSVPIIFLTGGFGFLHFLSNHRCPIIERQR